MIRETWRAEPSRRSYWFGCEQHICDVKKKVVAFVNRVPWFIQMPFKRRAKLSSSDGFMEQSVRSVKLVNWAWAESKGNIGSWNFRERRIG